MAWDGTTILTTERLTLRTFLDSDLDAYYAHPSQLAFTRNLVVASGHGLQPQLGDRKEQLISTPFRDVYQTSVFYALYEKASGVEVAIPTEGLIFEIGSGGRTHAAYRRRSRVADGRG